MPKRFAPEVTTLQDSTTISSMETLTLFGELEEFENQLRRYDDEDEAPIKKTLALQVESNNESDHEDFDEEIEMLLRKLKRLLQRKNQKGSSTPVSPKRNKKKKLSNYFMGLEDDDQLEIMADHYPRGYKELKGLFFNTHGPLDTMSWFSDHGVELKTEDDGRVFPVSNNSSSVIDCLMSEAKKRGVVVQTGKVVTTASTTACGKFILKIEKRTIDYVESVEADYLLIATGSSQQGYTLTTQLGHSIVDLVPSLFTFKIDDLRLAELSGVTFLKVKAKLELETVRKNIQQLTQVGPMLVTHWGLSGPVILRLSAWGARYLFSSDYKGILYVDFTPNLHIENVKSILIQHKNQFVKHKVLNSYPSELGLVKRFWKYILDREGLDGDILWASISNNSLMSVASLLKQCSFKVKGKGQFKDEFVTAGGVPLSEISLKTMESRLKSHLFLAGEVLNIDGVTGGFNFQNAWSGGYIAGTSVGNLAISATLKETVV